MDERKRAFRAKLAASKQKRIDSPLVRYNDADQPVCRVCNVVLKSDSLWNAHQASQKHHEAINSLRANAAGITRADNAAAKPHKELPKPASEQHKTLNNFQIESSAEMPKSCSSPVLPSDFFDRNEMKRQKVGTDAVKAVKPGAFAQTRAGVCLEEKKADNLPREKETNNTEVQRIMEPAHHSTKNIASKTKQGNGVLPEGFFDNKDADLRARGIEPIKPNVKDEYKEFEKLIQEDLQEVDNRLEEEEYDAAEMIEEAESVEQKSYRELVRMLKRKTAELKAAKSAAGQKRPRLSGEDSVRTDSSSDDDGTFFVDWRAQHL